MPNQEKPAPSPADVCPECRARTGDGVSLYVPNSALIKPNSGRPEPPANPIPRDPPVQDTTPETRHPQPPTQSIQFWQGLAAGLAVAIVVLFLIAA